MKQALMSLFEFAAARRRAAQYKGAQYKGATLALMLVGAISLASIVPVGADTRAKSSARKLTEEQRIIHLLNRLAYGPRPGDVERVKRMGVDKFIDQQLSPQRIDDSATQARLAGLDSLGMDVAQIYDKYPAPAQVARQLGLRMPQEANQPPGAANMQEQAAAKGDDAEAKAAQREMRQKLFAYYAERGLRQPQRLLQELRAQKIIRAVYSERQLQEVMADFWFNHFNIFWGKGADRWLTTDFEMNAIRPNTMGRFKDLLLATAKSPAMLFYLDNFQSMSPDAQLPGRRGMGRRGLLQRRQVPMRPQADTPEMTDQQRRARAANQLRNRKRGINENYAREIMELHTLGVEGGYTQKDVQEVARAFTGWTIEQPRQSGKFVFRPWMHDDGEKLVLGQKIPAGGGIKDGEMVIEILARHPKTARFISTKLVRRFVSDDPPRSLVERVAGVYIKTDGDIREMLKTIFTSEEFNSPDAYRAKIKSPFELAVSAVRALDGNTNGLQQMPQFIARMGQPLYLYQPPTGYPDRAEQWVNTGALLERLNFALALSANRVRGTRVEVRRAAGEVSGDMSQVMNHAIRLLLNGDVSAQTRAVLDKQLREGVSVKGELDGERPAAAPAAMSSVDSEMAKVYGLVLGSPEFQRR
jgi:uncharacterized protein (DUF1800 family)